MFYGKNDKTTTRKIPLQCGGFLCVEDSNPYDDVRVDEMLMCRGDGMTKPDEPAKPEVIELGAPQPHEIPHGEYEAIIMKKDDVPDQGIDMKKAIEIVTAIYSGNKAQEVGTRVELSDILAEASKSFKSKTVNLTWDRGELVIRTGVKGDKIHDTFKTLEEMLGSTDIARSAAAKLLVKELRNDHLATK